jgi:ribosomal protein S18 acetylase RimI-like enzyme
VGVVNVGVRCASPAVADALEVAEGAPVAMISNMAVAPGFRRQGLARHLVNRCCEAALRDLKPRPEQLMLLVYKDYDPARR